MIISRVESKLDENKFIKFTGSQNIARKKVGLDTKSIFKFVKKVNDKSRI